MIRDPQRFSELPPAGFDGVFDWDFLVPAFEGTKIQPMDLDCIIERHGSFLVFETKSGNNGIPQGQQITLEQLVKTGRFFVIILRAKRPTEITGWEVWFLNSGETIHRKQYKGDSNALCDFARRWFKWASREWLK